MNENNYMILIIYVYIPVIFIYMFTQLFNRQNPMWSVFDL